MFEDDLKAALRPVDPPEGFEQRVMARLNDAGGGGRGPVVRMRSFSSAWKAAAAGLAFASVAGIAVYNHQQQEQRRGLEARDKLILALQITGKKLDAVRTQINSNNPSNNEAQSQQ